MEDSDGLAVLFPCIVTDRNKIKRNKMEVSDDPAVLFACEVMRPKIDYSVAQPSQSVQTAISH